MFGGVTSFRNDQFRSVNGYSNIYFGWGAEDDDLYNRLVIRNPVWHRYVMKPLCDETNYCSRMDNNFIKYNRHIIIQGSSGRAQ